MHTSLILGKNYLIFYIGYRGRSGDFQKRGSRLLFAHILSKFSRNKPNFPTKYVSVTPQPSHESATVSYTCTNVYAKKSIYWNSSENKIKIKSTPISYIIQWFLLYLLTMAGFLITVILAWKPIWELLFFVWLSFLKWQQEYYGIN